MPFIQVEKKLAKTITLSISVDLQQVCFSRCTHYRTCLPTMAGTSCSSWPLLQQNKM